MSLCMAKLQARAAEYRWDDLRVFLALMRGRTLAAAATELGVDATTVGRRLTVLEGALGTVLFDRTRDGVLPTAAAEHLLPLAESAEHGASSVLATATSFERAPEGVVRLTAPPVVAEELLVPILAQVRATYPRIRVQVDASTSLADLSRREADIAIRVRKPESGDLVVTKLVDARYRAFANAALAEQLGVVTDLDEATWVGWTAEFSEIPSARWSAAHLQKASFALWSSSMTTHLAAARHGLGVALLPAPIGALHGLVEIRTRGRAREALLTHPGETVWLVGHRALRGVPRVDAVWNVLLERASAVLTEAGRRRR